MSKADRITVLFMLPVLAFGAIGVFAIAYHHESLRQRYFAGPRIEAPVERIYLSGKHVYWADVRYRNIVNGRDVECRSAVNAGRDPARFPVGSTITIVVKPGTCADAASICDR